MRWLGQSIGTPEVCSAEASFRDAYPDSKPGNIFWFGANVIRRRHRGRGRGIVSDVHGIGTFGSITTGSEACEPSRDIV